MGNARQLARISLRPDKVLEPPHMPAWPEPPPAMLKLPGVNEWWSNMRRVREQDIDAYNRFINNLLSQLTVIDGGTP